MVGKRKSNTKRTGAMDSLVDVKFSSIVSACLNGNPSDLQLTAKGFTAATLANLFILNSIIISRNFDTTFLDMLTKGGESCD